MQRQLKRREHMHRQRQLGDGCNVEHSMDIVNGQWFEFVPDISSYIRTNLHAPISVHSTSILVLQFTHRPLLANN